MYSACHELYRFAIPEALHRTLKARAARTGISLSSYLLAELRQIAERPTMDEFRERLEKRERVVLPEPAARAVRRTRDAG
jgi:antitoxin FitA